MTHARPSVVSTVAGASALLQPAETRICVACGAGGAGCRRRLAQQDFWRCREVEEGRPEEKFPRSIKSILDSNGLYLEHGVEDLGHVGKCAAALEPLLGWLWEKL